MTASYLKGQHPTLPRRNSPDAASELFELQIEQHHHDETYHREIARLPIHQRLNHMTLHYAKYVALIAEATLMEKPERIVARALIDSFIIALSTANILNVKLADIIIPQDQSFEDLRALGKFYSNGREDIHLPTLLARMAISVGQMAKACESVDHLESLPYRELLTSGLRTLVAETITSLAQLNIEPGNAARERLSGVKQRSIFHGHL